MAIHSFHLYVVLAHFKLTEIALLLNLVRYVLVALILTNSTFAALDFWYFYLNIQGN